MQKKYENMTLYAIAMILGAAAFICVYGINVLNPVYDNWLLDRGDLTQHYLGWCFYRRGSWTVPIGLTNQLAYPSYTSVIFTDSIPLFAVFFKLLSPWLPDTFQYFGWWGILCFALQGLFAAKLLRAFSVGKAQAVIGSIFFILSPIVIEKMFRHTALGGHWIILAAIYLFVKHRELYSNITKSSIYWGMIGILVSAVHLYYLPMCGAFLGGFILCSFLRARKVRARYLIPGVAFAISLFGVTYFLGGFSSRADYESDGLGRFSFNLNGFFNAKGYSRFLDALPTYADGQYEGFAYLGLGIYILLFCTMIYVIMIFIKRQWRFSRETYLYGAVYGIMIIGLVLFATSPLVTFNDRLLFTLTDSSTLQHLWSIFRATGRMIWPVCYLVYIGAIIGTDRLCKKYMHKEHIAVIMIVLCCILQIFDIDMKLMEQRNNFGQKIVYQSPLKNKIWEKISSIESLEHFIWVPNYFENKEMLHLAKFAYDSGLTMNTYYFARGIDVRENTKESMEHLNDTCVYLFQADDVQEAMGYGLHLYEADGYIIGTTFLLE